MAVFRVERNTGYSEFNLYCPFPAVHRLTLLSIPRVWDTSQQAIFNRRAAAQEGENTERVPLSYACYESFFLIPTTTESPVLPNLHKRKTLQSQKDYNAS